MALNSLQTIFGPTTTTRGSTTTATSVSGNIRTITESTPVTTTRNVTDRFDNGVIDVSIIPYMRHQLLQFSAEGLRPNRRVFFYFDDEEITDSIIRTNQIILNQNASNTLVNSGFSNTDFITGNTSAGSAQIISASRFYDFINTTPSNQDNGTARERKRILQLANISGQFANNEGFLTSITGLGASIGSITINGSENLSNFFQNTSSNTVTLPPVTSVVANNYWGTNSSNTIILMTSSRVGGKAVRAYITGWDNVSRKLSLSNTLGDIITANPTVSIPTSNTSAGQISWSIPPTSANEFYTDFEGKVSGTFVVPAGQFRTGERIFRVIDAFSNDPSDATTRADYKFNSNGIKQTKNDIVINSVESTTEIVQKTRTEVIPPPPQEPIRSDPIAQTFFVEASLYPNGVFLSAIGLYVRTKDEILPLKIEIRPTVNGYPNSYDVVPGSIVSIDAERIRTSENASIETKFNFDHPVHLPPGEWAVVVKSDSLQYEVFSAELGGKIIGTNRTVSEQPYLGSFFKSQNASTWDAIQLEDLTFNLYKCKFASSGTVTLYNSLPVNNAFADVIFTHMDDVKLSNTNIRYAHSYDAGLTTTNCDIDTDIVPASRVSFYKETSNIGKYRLTATLSTTDTDVSPYLYTSGGKIIAVENYIDNAELAQTNFTITNTGSGYLPNANITLEFTGLSGTSATAYAVSNATGHIISIVGGNPGSGYTQNISLFSANSNVSSVISAANGTGATIAISSEIDSSGGPAASKYISRVATLAQGFEATDLRVFLTAYKPSGTEVLVYYKVKSPNDPEPFEDKKYTLMTQRTGSGVYSTQEGFRNSAIEYEFEPQDSSNLVSYTSGTSSYDTFNQFALKVVLLSNDTTKVPVVYDMRAIALP